MSISAISADAFVIEVIKNQAVWAIRDNDGFPTSTNASGETTMPFWSTESRAKRIIEGVAAYHGFQPVQLDLDTFTKRWLPGLERDLSLQSLPLPGGGCRHRRGLSPARGREKDFIGIEPVRTGRVIREDSLDRQDPALW